jgi:hypothetical protein
MMLVSSLAFAQAKGEGTKGGGAKPGGAMEMPKPPAELAVEKWFEGKWKCEVTQHASPMGPEGKFAQDLAIKMDIQGWWLNFHVERTKGPMAGAMVGGYAGWDAAAKKHVRSDFSFGGNMANFTSAGWEGDKLVFAGDTVMMGKKMPAKHTFTKKGDSQFMTVYEVTGPDGKPMTLLEEDCKKGGAAK